VWASDAEPRADFTPMALPVEAARGADRIDAHILVQSRRIDPATGAWEPWRDEPAIEVHAPLSREGSGRFLADTSPTLDARIRTAFHERVMVWLDAARPVGIRHGRGTLAGTEWADACIGVAWELRERGTVRRRMRFWWHGGAANPSFGWTNEVEDVPALLRLAAMAERGEPPVGWTVAIEGDAEAAARAIPLDAATVPAARWWQGHGEWPVELEFGGRQATPRLFRREPVSPAGTRADP
jgi:hypothetical protein